MAVNGPINADKLGRFYSNIVVSSSSLNKTRSNQKNIGLVDNIETYNNGRFA